MQLKSDAIARKLTLLCWVKLLADNYKHAPQMYENFMHLPHQAETLLTNIKERVTVSFPWHVVELTNRQHTIMHQSH
jgi:hypothetical protein